MINKANSSLGYLKIITPKKRTIQDISNNGITKITFGKQIENESKSKPISNWSGSNMDPDSMKRHYNSLNRAGFKDNKQAKGIF